MDTRILGKLALYCKEVFGFFAILLCNNYGVHFAVLFFQNRNFNTRFDDVPCLGLLA